MEITPELLPTADGSHTLRHPLLGDCYHSINGALGESRHVFIEAGLRFCGGNSLRIFEVGFGSGLNALMTLEAAAESGTDIVYHAIELYPIAKEIALQLNYCGSEHLKNCFTAMHYAPWGVETEITHGFRLKKTEGSLLNSEIDGIFNLIYFDAFSPDTQPELWSEEVFRHIALHTETGGVLVTYSAKGVVKRALRAAGFEVSRLPGALGKRHMLRAVKI